MALSKQLYAIFEEGFHLEETRQAARDATRAIEDICNSYLVNDTPKLYVCGSFAEATFTPDTIGDVDVIVCTSATPVLFNIDDAGPGISYLAENTSKPGYWKFRLVKDGRPANKDDIDERDHRNFEIVNDELYLKQAKLTLGFQEATETGPADALQGSGGEHVFDMVFALGSKQIPPECKERLNGFNENNTWDKNTVKDLDKMGCLFVAASHTESDARERGIQWRLSFSLQERHLVTNMNPVQHKVYILMKLLKKEKLNTSAEIISSYMCKTCMLYVIEETPREFWTEENLIEGLLKCLKVLHNCTMQKNCPNYFIKEANMFERDTILGNDDDTRVSLKDAKVIDEVGATLDVLLKKQSFLYEIDSDNIGESLQKYKILNFENKRRNVVFKVKWGLIGLFLIMRDLILFQIRPCSYEKLLKLLKRVDDNATFNAYIAPWVNVHLGVSLAAQTQGEKIGSARVQDAFGYIEQGSEAGFSASLAKVTVLLQSKQWEDCLQLLQETEDMFANGLTACRCYDSVKATKMPVPFEVYYDATIWRGWGQKTITEIMKNKLASCFCFLRCEASLIPAPLKHELKVCKNEDECGINDFYRSRVIVDAKVYMYTLLYLASDASGDEQRKEEAVQKILGRLPKELPRPPGQRVPESDEENNGHNHVTLNILGWIMMQEKRYLAATKYFMKSWKLLPRDNAAKFHIRDLLGKLQTLSEQRRRQMEHFICAAIRLPGDTTD